MRSELARGLQLGQGRIQCDAQCKKVLSQKIILAWILKNVADEFRQMAYDEIVSCIEGIPEISKARVNPGETNAEIAAGQITGMPNEDKTAYEGVIYYDIRFYVTVPAQRERVRMIINVEAQKDYYPGYEIVTRGIFYGARMISAQLGTEFSIPDYNGVRKVYSIWICMNAPKYVGNAISIYHLTKDDAVPGLPDRPFSYDKMTVAVVALNDEIQTENTFLSMMNTVLSPKVSYPVKKRILEREFGPNMDKGTGEEVKIMCNYSEYVEQKGIEKGIEKGRGQGLALTQWLLRENRMDDLNRAFTDEKYCKRLYNEFNMAKL